MIAKSWNPKKQQNQYNTVDFALADRYCYFETELSSVQSLGEE